MVKFVDLCRWYYYCSTAVLVQFSVSWKYVVFDVHVGIRVRQVVILLFLSELIWDFQGVKLFGRGTAVREGQVIKFARCAEILILVGYYTWKVLVVWFNWVHHFVASNRQYLLYVDHSLLLWKVDTLKVFYAIQWYQRLFRLDDELVLTGAVLGEPYVFLLLFYR